MSSILLQGLHTFLLFCGNTELSMTIVHSHLLSSCSGVDDTPLLESIMVDGATLKPRWVRLLIVSVYNIIIIIVTFLK